MLMNLIKKVDFRAAAAAGLAAGTIYIATQEVDNRITGQNNDDLKLLGRLVVDNPDLSKVVGLGPHYVNSVILASLYAAVGHDHLPGPPWFRGALFAVVENSVLYPLALLEDYHPGIRRGEIDRYLTLKAFLQSIPRHITFGAVLGEVYERKRVSA